MAVQACQEKKAEDINILRLDAASGLTDYFVICSGANPRQVEAIGEAVDEKLSRAGFEPLNIDGRRSADWMVLERYMRRLLERRAVVIRELAERAP